LYYTRPDKVVTDR